MRRTLGQFLVLLGMATLIEANTPTQDFGWRVAYLAWWVGVPSPCTQERPMTLRYEGVRFSDGSCAVRRVAVDPCDRATLTFETVRQLEEDIGSADVSWIGDNFLPQQAPMCDQCGLRRARCGTLGKPGEYCSLACLQAAEAEEAAKTKAVFSPPSRLNGWQLHDLETGQELRPGMAVRVATMVGDPPRPAYVGDGHPAVRSVRYEPTEEIDEP